MGVFVAAKPGDHRRRLLPAPHLHQLTPEGEAAELAPAIYDEALGNRGDLQSVR